MIPPSSRTFLTRWKLGVVGVVVMSVVAAISLSSPAARAAEPGESSGELGGASGDKAKQPAYQLQAADPDNPTDPAVVAAKKQAALDAALAKKNAKVEAGPPIYQKWQFWAIAGGVLVGLLGAIYATTKVVHSANGGDVGPCPTGYVGCFGEGR
jgi:hypothetical protein